MMRILSLAILVLSISQAQAAPAGPTTRPIGRDLVVNGGFEEGLSGWMSIPTGAQYTGELVTIAPHSGKSCFRLINKSAFAPNVYGRVFQTVRGLEPYTTYRISCYVRGKNAGLCWIGGGPGWFHRQPFPKGTYDWTYVETLWTTTQSDGNFDLMICTESPTEALDIDDVKMEPISADIAKRDKALAGFDILLEQQLAHFRQVQTKAATQPAARQDPIIRLGLAVAKRFLDRASRWPAIESRPWINFELEEVDDVLNRTDHQIDQRAKAAGWASPTSPADRPTAQPYPIAGPVTFHNGELLARTNVSAKPSPWFFYGMGHFGQVFKDLPFWRVMGASIVQDGQVGPNGIAEDGSLLDSARTLLADVDRASLYDVKVDYLLSPHYFPDWAWKLPHAEEMHQAAMGFLGFDIDHPIARDVIGRWADIISKDLKDKPALLSLCLSNEPVWNASGRTKYSLPEYQDYLKNIHHDIGALNALYGTNYKDFNQIQPPPAALSPDVKKNRAYYDWQRFNKEHFAGWHAWIAGIIHKNLPKIPVHAKIMVFFTMDRDKLGWGVDPELMCDATDIAGCDAYASPAPDYRTYDWRGEEFWYDLLNSFHNQPVFNSENHIIPDGTGPVHIPPTMTRAQYWQGALHHQWLTTTWVWEEATAPGLGGSIYFRPGNVYGAGRAFLDLGRFAKQVAAINAAPARVALLYSPTSVFWSDKYYPTILDLYTRLTFLGQKVTFVSEKQLQQGRTRDGIRCIILPQATNVEDATIDGLKKFLADGGKLLAYGNGNLGFDAYQRPRKLPAELSRLDKFTFQKNDSPAGEQMLRGLLKTAGIDFVDLIDSASGKLAWNVEYRLVEQPDATLIPIINFAAGTVEVKFPALADRQAVDLLSGRAVNLGRLNLEPMRPMLIQIRRGPNH